MSIHLFKLKKMSQPSPSRCLSIQQFIFFVIKNAKQNLKGLPSQAAFSSAVGQLCLDSQWEKSKQLGRLCCKQNYLRIKLYIYTLPHVELLSHCSLATDYSQVINNISLKNQCLLYPKYLSNTLALEETKLPFLECCFFIDIIEKILFFMLILPFLRACSIFLSQLCLQQFNVYSFDLYLSRYYFCFSCFSSHRFWNL